MIPPFIIREQRMSLTKGQIKILHVAKRKLGLDEDTYRGALYAYGGARSSTKLNYDGFKNVMRHFERCGFKSKGRKPPIKKHGKERPGMATPGQIRKIYALWMSLGGSYYKKDREWQALRGFLKKRFGADHENFLRFDTAGKVIEALKAIGARRQTAVDAERRADGG